MFAEIIIIGIFVDICGGADAIGHIVVTKSSAAKSTSMPACGSSPRGEE